MSIQVQHMQHMLVIQVQEDGTTPHSHRPPIDTFEVHTTRVLYQQLPCYQSTQPFTPLVSSFPHMTFLDTGFSTSGGGDRRRHEKERLTQPQPKNTHFLKQSF